MGTSSTPSKEPQGTTLHVPIRGELRKKLDQMRADDRRERNDFVRLLIEDEWERRKKTAEGNGHRAKDIKDLP